MKLKNILKFSVIGCVIGTGIGCCIKFYKKLMESQGKLAYKYNCYYQTLNQWLKLLHRKKYISDYLIKTGYHKIAIYGIGNLGKRFIEELENTSVEIKYLIDKEPPKNLVTTIPYRIPEELPKDVDAIIVTAVFDYEAIEHKLVQKTKIPILSLQDLVFDIEEQI